MQAVKCNSNNVFVYIYIYVYSLFTDVDDDDAWLGASALPAASRARRNDPRPGRMQERLIDLLLNKDMLQVDQQYSEAAAYAGGRIWSGPTQQELWAKPLTSPANAVAVVLFNRAGIAVGDAVTPLPPHCNDKTSSLGPCVGCFLNDNVQSPCDDNVTASSGSQAVELQFSQISRSWLGLNNTSTSNGASAGGTVSCNVFDIFATPGKGASLGRITGSWSAMVPPHGSRFIRLEGCTLTAE